MKKAIAALLAVALAIPLFAQKPGILQAAHRTTHEIRVATLVESARKCSATAYGPHALLTASHCELPTSVIEVDGKTMLIKGVMRDGFDHTILLVDGEFKNYAEIATTPLQTGDDIFVIGNPGMLTDVLRKGYVAKAPVAAPNVAAIIFFGPQALACFFDFNGFFGDSGAAVFNSNGEIAGVISQILAQQNTPGGPQMNLMSGYPLKFTPIQLAKARAFVPRASATDLDLNDE